MSLKWSDICFFTNRIKVKKSKAGKIQYVPMNILAIEAFKKLKSMPVHVSNEVFYQINNTTCIGQYWKLDEAWRKYVVKAGIESIRWHDLRHTFSSRMVMAGVNILTVQKLCRHADIRQTMRYAHLAPKYLQEGVNALVNWSELTPELAPNSEDASR